ncbi:MAG: AAA family ATPase [Bdellovibrionota bacterium]
MITKTMRFSPITGILGHRQVGKTTLASLLSDCYVTLDLGTELSDASAEPMGFLAKHKAKPLIIDECQLAPALFPALKEWVRLHKEPGQFLLTGSVRFSSRKAIRESLTGRIINWELLPMDWAEQNSQPLADKLLRLMKAKDLNIELKCNPTFTLKTYSRYLYTGGLPGVFGVRDAGIRTQRMETQINTILERDLKLLVQTSLDFKTLRRLLAALASQAGRRFSISEVARVTRISLPTLRKLISALESMFVIRFIPSEGDFLKPVLFFEDLAECAHLYPGVSDPQKSFLLFLYQNLRTQFHYRPEARAVAFSYAERSGHEIPLCFRCEQRLLGIIPVIDESTLSTAHKDARNFIKRYPAARVLLVGLGNNDLLMSRNIRYLGVNQML